MTAGEPNNDPAIQRLEAVLAAYGADPARWPESDRPLAALIATGHPGHAAALQEARVVDSALARASRPALPAGAPERLLARAAEAPVNTVPFVPRTQARPPGRTDLPGRLAIASALAASLALGLYLGASGQGDWLLPPGLAPDTAEYLAGELDVLDDTLQLFEEHTEP